MKAEYILSALEAMREAEQILSKPFDIDAHQSWRMQDKLSKARIALHVHSGLDDVEVEIAQR